MKKRMLILLILGYQTANAQISLDKRFQENQMNVVNLSSTYYYSTSIKNSIISIYRENYAFYKSITLVPPSNYSIGSVTLSDKTFNNSVDIEFLVTVNKLNGEATDADYCKQLLYNENGQIIYDFGSATIITSYFFKTASGLTKLFLQRMTFNPQYTNYIYSTEIYSLPGNYTGVSAIKSPNEVHVNYDAERKTVEFLPTQVTDNFILKLYNPEGRELIQRQYNEFNNGKISISTENLNSGVYIFSLNEVSGKILIK